MIPKERADTEQLLSLPYWAAGSWRMKTWTLVVCSSPGRKPMKLGIYMHAKKASTLVFFVWKLKFYRPLDVVISFLHFHIKIIGIDRMAL